MRKSRRLVASGPGGTEPASQHGKSSPDAPASPAGTRRSFRRLLATPTFFAGACIVFAATLAYGTTQTHLVFSGGSGSRPGCTPARCAASGAGNGTVKSGSATMGRSARPGPDGARRQGSVTGRPAGTPSPGAAPGPSAHPKTSRPAGAGPKAGSSPVTVAYQTLRSWPGGFLAVMTITNHGTSAVAGWQLWMHYAGARVVHVWGAGWSRVPRHPGAGLATPRPGQRMLLPGASTQFTFRVTGRPGPPAGCFFNTTRCSFR